MRKFIVALALSLGLYFVFAKLAEVQAIVDTLHRGELGFILLALLVEGLWVVNVTASYHSIYQALGMDEKPKTLLILSSAANFVNIVAPSGGMGGMAVFITQARRQGHSTARVTVAGVLFVLCEYIGFLCVLAVGLFVLFRNDNLNASELAATAILVVVAALLSLVVYLGMRSEKKLGCVLAWSARRVNGLLRPLIHRDYLSEHRAHEFAHDAAEGLKALRRRREDLLKPVFLALSSKALLVMILMLMFRAFQVPFTFDILVAGWSIGYLFLIVSPTPAGIGVVEGVLTLALNSLQIPLGSAAVITLAYRGLTFWAPLLFGMLAFRSLSAPSRPVVVQRGSLTSFSATVSLQQGEIERE